MFDTDAFQLTLAQDQGGAAPLPFEGTTPATPSGGTTTPAGGGAPPAGPLGGGSGLLLLMVALMVVMVIISSLGPRREKKKREAMINAVRKHDKVQTVGGVIGSIVELKPDFVVLKVDESANTRITFARSAIQQVLTTDGGGGSPNAS